MNKRIVIVGAGHAGGTLAALLRQFGHQGPIVLIGAEPELPYQRPPLSKAYLKGVAERVALLLKPANFYAEKNIELCLDAEVTGIDAEAKTVALSCGETISYDILVLATGARPRPLVVPGAELPGIHMLRSIADADNMIGCLKPGSKLAIIGGGYVGLEVAASARALGSDVIVIEREPRVLARVASEELSRFFVKRHQAEGVEFRCSALVETIERDRVGAVTGLHLSDGSRIAADCILAGIGALPNLELAQTAGLDCDQGILVDEEARTSAPDIFAIGDVTRRPLPIYDGRLHRIESVPNALEQARIVASVLTGRPLPKPEVPWFWSDQYELKLQIAGLPVDATRTVLRGSAEAGSFSLFHLRDNRVRAVEAVNAPADFMAAKQWISAGTEVPVERLSDTAIAIKDVLN